jgi:hypothetical protein
VALDFPCSLAALRPHDRDGFAPPGAPQGDGWRLSLAKPNYRHQKKQKELARKTRHAEKLKKRLERDETPGAEGADGAGLQSTTPESSSIESKP